MTRLHNAIRAMNKPLKVAIAGAGMISHHHLIAWSKLDNVRVVAVSDPLRKSGDPC
mgnify:CR=1 FL=1